MIEAGPQPAVSEHELRWFQSSLRTLLTYVTLCAIAFSWLAVAIVEGRRERKAEVALGEMGYVVACSAHYRADWFGSLSWG